MADFLKDIIEHKKKVVVRHREFYDRIRARIEMAQYEHYSIFKKQISQPGKINLIAEIKKASPSLGLIRENFAILEIAKAYAEAGAAAFSILTEEKYFLGNPMHIKMVAEQFKPPILRKDFIIDPGQVYEAQYLGASAILLIVAILSDSQIKDLLTLATRLDLDCLVEVHDETELKRALDCGAEIIGINNRNLKTFEVSLETSFMLIPKIPNGKVIVAESGIKTADDVRRLKAAGVNAVLIGETFMRSADIGAKVREIMNSV